jgi:hypothetical protein
MRYEVTALSQAEEALGHQLHRARVRFNEKMISSYRKPQADLHPLYVPVWRANCQIGSPESIGLLIQRKFGLPLGLGLWGPKQIGLLLGLGLWSKKRAQYEWEFLLSTPPAAATVWFPLPCWGASAAGDTVPMGGIPIG